MEPEEIGSESTTPITFALARRSGGNKERD